MIKVILILIIAFLDTPIIEFTFNGLIPHLHITLLFFCIIFDFLVVMVKAIVYTILVMKAFHYH